jgi:membrane associated rhomboid family serine protease
MEDVDTVLVRWGLIKVNYARLEKEKVAARELAVATADLSSHQKKARKKALDPGMNAVPNLANLGKIAGVDLDRNNDGEVDFQDILESQVEGDAMEDELVEDIKRGRHFPFFVVCQCLVCLGFWVVYAYLGSQDGKGAWWTLKGGLDSVNKERMFSLRLAGTTDCEDYRHEAWRWILYQYTHIGSAHVFMNCFLVIILGVPLEGQHGMLRLLLMFQAGVFGGALCYFVGDGHNIVVGMSGGCYSLIGIAFADLIMNWKQKRFRKPALAFLIVLIACDLTAYSLALSSKTTSHTAHVGGFIAGLLGGILLVRNKKVDFHEKILYGIDIVLIVLLIAFCLGWLFTQWPPEDIWEKLDPSTKEPVCWTRQIWDPQINERSYVCVQCKCGDEACKSQWSSMEYVKSVTLTSCNTQLQWHTKC